MKTLIAAFALSLSANAAMADGFAPWNDRAVAADTPSTSVADTAPAGFAPWRDRDVRRLDAGQVSGEFRMSVNDASIFRPWS